MLMSAVSNIRTATFQIETTPDAERCLPTTSKIEAATVAPTGDKWKTDAAPTHV
jgi:hypothetical protein